MSDDPELVAEWREFDKTEFGRVTGNVTIDTTPEAPAFSFPGVTITFDPPHVELDPAVDWDGAAKSFWNAVCRCVGQKPPFGW